MRIENYLWQGNYTMLNKPLARNIWIPQTAFLCELISQRTRFWKDEFYFTQSDMEKELWLSESTQMRYAKELKEKWLINFEKKGIPARNWFTINDDKIHDIIMWGTCAVNLTGLETSDWRDSYNNKESNKSNKENNQPKQEKHHTHKKISELDKIKNSDDIRDILSEDEIQQYKIQLKIILKMVELWYKINKSKEDIEKEIEWLKAKAKLYWLIQWDGNIAWNTFYQKIDKRFDWHTEKWKPVKNFKTSIIPFISK